MNEIEHIKTLPCILLAFFALFTLFMVSRLIISYGVNLLYSAGCDLRYEECFAENKAFNQFNISRSPSLDKRIKNLCINI